MLNVMTSKKRAASETWRAAVSRWARRRTVQCATAGVLLAGAQDGGGITPQSAHRSVSPRSRAQEGSSFGSLTHIASGGVMVVLSALLWTAGAAAGGSLDAPANHATPKPRRTKVSKIVTPLARTRLLFLPACPTTPIHLSTFHNQNPIVFLCTRGWCA